MAPSGSSTGKQLESIWKLGGLTFWQLTRKVIHGIGEDDLFGRASELAYNFLLALFPLLLFMLTLFGLFARSIELQSSLMSYFADFLPPSAFQLLKAITLEMAANATGGKLTFGIILTLWFASGGMSSMISTLDAVYHVRESRSWFRGRAIALGLTIAISILLLTSLFIVLVGGHFSDWIALKLHLTSIVVIAWKGLQWVAVVLFLTLSFSLIYYFGPSLNQRQWHWITPGSIFGEILWLAASAGLRIYLHFFNTYTATYGSLAAMMILLVWLYITGLAFLIGGEINAQIERTAMRVGTD
ncbi:MAG TPA: YihY/virulence factor BrkB family protein [Candidatus Angelobacter sp.]|nr:YihY/virulence factor BrkB family protein [Candidatus Angelobacter sp.]